MSFIAFTLVHCICKCNCVCDCNCIFKNSVTFYYISSCRLILHDFIVQIKVEYSCAPLRRKPLAVCRPLVVADSCQLAPTKLIKPDTTEGVFIDVETWNAKWGIGSKTFNDSSRSHATYYTRCKLHEGLVSVIR